LPNTSSKVKGSRQDRNKGNKGNTIGWASMVGVQIPTKNSAHMAKQLNLTSDQQSKIKPILDNQAQQMQQLHRLSSL
jgi:Spy/CpxP family protein refolding chaperone